jgi:chromosomal replication initiation ATPase DnaA
LNGSSINPERAWQMALDQLHMDMPKAAFDTWARDASLVSFEDGVFTVGTINSYGREWLASRLTSTAARILTGILNQQVDVQYTLLRHSLATKIGLRAGLVRGAAARSLLPQPAYG